MTYLLAPCPGEMVFQRRLVFFFLIKESDFVSHQNFFVKWDFKELSYLQLLDEVGFLLKGEVSK